MIKINYPETKQKDRGKIFQEAEIGRFFLLSSSNHAFIDLVQKVHDHAGNIYLSTTQSGSHYFDADETLSKLSSGDYTLTPVDVEITVTHK